MKKKKITKISTTYTTKDYFNAALVIFFSSLILSALAYWKISPVTYREFDTTCQHFSYHDCMRWFNETKPYFTRITIGGLIVSALSLIGAIVLFIKSKKK